MSNVRAVDRAVAILQCFSSEKPSMSVVEIQRLVGLSRPTLYRLLETLAATGLIRSEGDPQRFKLAHGVMKLAHVWLSELDVVDIARPIIEGLRNQTGETAALFVLSDELRVCVLELQSRHVLSISRGVGDTGHVSQGASGKAILAFFDDERRAAVTDKLPDDFARADLVTALAAARRDGYAVSRGEVFAGAVAIAAPYSDFRGQVIGSVGVFGPSARLDDDRLAQSAPLVVAAAQSLSAELGARLAGPRSSNAVARL